MKYPTHKAVLLGLAMAPKSLLPGVASAYGAAPDADILTPRSSGDKTPSDVDAIIVGGGYSGLMSAYQLQQAGFTTLVLEAKEKIGGRSRSHNLTSGPGIIELGATWINEITQPVSYGLTQQFGLETAEQYTEGDSVIQGPDGVVRRIPQDVVPDPENPITQLEGRLFGLIDEATQRVDLRKWHEFPEEEDVSFADWVEMQGGLWEHEYIRRVCSGLTTAIVGREPDEIGAHYFFDYIKAGGGLDDLTSEGKVGAQSLMIRQGTTAIATALAGAMKPGSVLVNSPVNSIKQEKGKTIVTTEAGKKFKAKKVILAIPTNMYADIKFTPALPCKKNKIISRTKPGIYAKMILTYTKPWWRTAGLVGKFTSLIGPVCFSWETSDPALSQYSLAIFVAGDIATRWHALPDAEKESSIIEHLAVLVGEDLADTARNVLEVNYVEWTKEEYLGGAPTNSMGPGMLRKYGKAFREPFGSVHFGGGETAFEWKGYLEGALLAGKRVAGEVEKALGGGQ